MIPLVHKEVVERYGFMTDEEFSNVLAIGNTLPGPIVSKMGGYIGFKTGGLLGCLNALIATLVPVIVLMIGALSVLNEYRDTSWVKGMAQGVVPVVAWMMVKLTYDFFKKGQKAVGLAVTIGLAVATLAAIILVGIHPGIIVFAVLLFALVKPVPQSEKAEEKATC